MYRNARILSHIAKKNIIFITGSTKTVTNKPKLYALAAENVFILNRNNLQCQIKVKMFKLHPDSFMIF